MNNVICLITDMGQKTKINQDTSYVGKIYTQIGESLFAVICDGVGSCEHSEIASQRAVDCFCDWFNKCYETFADTASEDEFCSLLYERWFALFDIINNYIINYAEVNKIRLGTTLSCILVRKSHYYILHIGDTRIYKIEKEMTLLTADHTVTAREVLRGKLTPVQARTDKRRHSLIKCIGMKEHMRPDFCTGTIERGGKFIICSDGFRDKIMDEQIFEAFKKDKFMNKSSLVKSARKVIKTVRQCGEKDNITAAVIQVCEE